MLTNAPNSGTLVVLCLAPCVATDAIRYMECKTGAADPFWLVDYQAQIEEEPDGPLRVIRQWDVGSTVPLLIAAAWSARMRWSGDRSPIGQSWAVSRRWLGLVAVVPRKIDTDYRV